MSTAKHPRVEHAILKVQEGIAAQKESRLVAQRLALLYIEFGFKACERGENLEMAIRRYHEINKPKEKPDAAKS